MDMENFANIQFKQEGHIAQLLLDRPKKRHAMNGTLVDEMMTALAHIENNSEVRVLILSSTDQYFCSGVDLAEGTGKYKDSEEQILKMFYPVLNKIRTLPQTVLAAVPGTTAGIGCAFVLCSDLIMMHESASLFFAFSKIGLIADGGLHWLLYQQLGYQKTFELLVQGGSLDAQSCYNFNIANKIVAATEDTLEQAQIWAQELALCAPISTQQTKKLLHEMRALNYSQAVGREAQSQKICEQSQDAHEGIAAFLEKRQACFQGK